MEIIEPRYYDLGKFSNTQYLMMAEVKKYFADNIFRGNRDRVIYASPEYMFRQRLNLLSQNNVSSVEALDMPFMSYFRENNWQLDTRLANLNAVSALVGRPDDIIGGQHLRYMPMEQTFTCTALFSNDVDAQLAYEALLFIQYPSEKMIISDGIEYKGYKVPVYVGIQVSNIEFNRGYKETNWLRENRIIPITFTLKSRSVVFSQAPQGPESTIFQNDGLPTLTERVFLDFLSYQDQNDPFVQQNIVLIVSGIITPDPTLNAVTEIENITTDSLTFNWDYAEEADTFYEDTVQIYYNAIDPITVPREQKTYTFTNLNQDSLYNVSIVFTSKKGEMYKYTSSASTNVTSRVTLKGMRG